MEDLVGIADYFNTDMEDMVDMVDNEDMLETKESKIINTGMEGIDMVSTFFLFSSWYNRKIMVVGRLCRRRRCREQQHQWGNFDQILISFHKVNSVKASTGEKDNSNVDCGIEEVFTNLFNFNC